MASSALISGIASSAENMHFNLQSLSTIRSKTKRKLDFSGIKLYGREQEIAILHEAYDRVLNGKSSLGKGESLSEIVIVHGLSGTGKSSMVYTLRESASQEGYFASGKFDQTFRDYRPFSGVADMFSELCDLIFLNTQRLDAIKASLKRNLTDDYAAILANIVPNIRNILETVPHVDDTVCTAQRSTFEKLKFAFREFVRSTCDADHPVVLFMDDLQWADSACLELLRTIIEDKEIEGLLFVGAYRGEEIVDTLKHGGPVTKIQLHNLSLSCTNQMIADLTELVPTSTASFADLVHHRTNGNPLYSIQFLKLLEDEKLLVFSPNKEEWEWSIEGIKSETEVSENVVDMVAANIKKLPQNTQNALIVAACLGCQVEAKLLALVMAECFQSQEEERTLFDLAEKEGIISRTQGSDWFKFSHDRIRQAAYSLLPEGRERDQLHWRIGQVLKNACSSYEETYDWMLLMATDQLNAGSDLIDTEEDQIHLAQSNLQAAEAAREKASFFKSVEYLKKGISLVTGPKKWSTEYDLLLRLTSSLAEMQHCVGDTHGCHDTARIALTHARSLSDKLPVYFTLVEALGQGENEHEVERAITIGLDVLVELGFKLPKNPGKFNTICYVLRTKCLLRGMDDDALLSLPVMKDAHELTSLKMMEVLIFFSWYHQKKDIFVSLVFHMMALTVRSGISKYSAQVFAYYGFLLASTGNFDDGFRFGQLATKLSERFQAKECDAQTIGKLLILYQGHLSRL